MSQEVIWNKWAKVLLGDYQGWYAQFEDDSQGETGGAYVYIVQSLEGKGEAYDVWLEDRALVDSYVQEVGWVLEYLPEMPE